WGEQTKPAGQDAYLTWDAGENMYYMVNADVNANGLPISYIEQKQAVLDDTSVPSDFSQFTSDYTKAAFNRAFKIFGENFSETKAGRILIAVFAPFYERRKGSSVKIRGISAETMKGFRQANESGIIPKGIWKKIESGYSADEETITINQIGLMDVAEIYRAATADFGTSQDAIEIGSKAGMLSYEMRRAFLNAHGRYVRLMEEADDLTLDEMNALFNASQYSVGVVYIVDNINKFFNIFSAIGPLADIAANIAAVIAHAVWNLRQGRAGAILTADRSSNPSDVIMLSENASLEDALEYAAKKAALGKDVHLMLPLTGKVSADFNRVKISNTGEEYIYRQTYPQANGKSVNVYYYSGKMQDAALSALNWLSTELDGNVAIVEVEQGSELDGKTARLLDALPFAERFYYNDGTSEREKADISAERRRVVNEGENMRNMPGLARTIGVNNIKDLSVFDSYEFIETFIIETDVVGYESNKEQVKQFAAAAHAKDKRVVIRFNAQDAIEAQDILDNISNGDLKKLRSNLSQKQLKRLGVKISKSGVKDLGYLKSRARGIDGVIFNFSSLSAQDINNISASFADVSFSIKKENADALIAVETSAYNDAISESGVKNFNDTNSFYQTSPIADSVTVDPQELKSEIDEAMERNVKMIVMGEDILAALKKADVNFDIQNFFKKVVSKWAALMRATPEGSYRNGKRAGLSERSASLTDEKAAYSLLRDMRSASFSDYAPLVKQLSDIAGSAKANRLYSLEKLKDEKNGVLLFEEAKGYLQGLLESLEMQKPANQNLSFAVKTDLDIYRSMLVEAKMALLLDAIDVEKVKDKEYVNPSKELLEADAIVNSQTAQTAEEMREAINLLTLYVESSKPEDANRPIALSKLIDLLGVYNREVKMDKNDLKVIDNRDAVLAILSAA
ncbi:MAG: hypothetical protein LBO62_00680, partial [Endomicrobium sp.]|nr:hypothetical protein [Endomicrobium sp.]